MKGLVTFLVLLASIAVGHAAVLYLTPGVIMSRAMKAMEQRDLPTHSFRLADRMTPQTQTVVRPSPDLAYSLCLFDFDANDRKPLVVHAAPWSDYSSLSFYDEKTDNFASLRGEGEEIDMVLLPPGASGSPDNIVSPTDKGIILIRRLAPTEEAYRAVEEIAVEDACRAVKQGGTGP